MKDPNSSNLSPTASNADVVEGSKFYFLEQQQSCPSNGSNASNHHKNSVRFAEVIDAIPDGADRQEFESRRVLPLVESKNEKNTKENIGLFNKILHRKEQQPQQQQHYQQEHITPPIKKLHPEIGTLLKPRKCPVKVEPKVNFANERTLICWFHVLIWLTISSVNIVRLTHNPYCQLYGLLQFAAVLVFGCYALFKHHQRAMMIKRKDPGPYEDLRGPTILGIFVMISIVGMMTLRIFVYDVDRGM